MEEKWFEKLHDWDKALELYRDKLASTPAADQLDAAAKRARADLELGQMRCLEALGEWPALYQVRFL